MEYTRDLGYCAAKYLLEGGSGAMVTIQHGVFKPIPLTELLDPRPGEPASAWSTSSTESYRIARRYMLRLRKRRLRGRKRAVEARGHGRHDDRTLPRASSSTWSSTSRRRSSSSAEHWADCGPYG